MYVTMAQLNLSLGMHPVSPLATGISVLYVGVARFINISRYFSRDKYRDIIFYNHNFFIFFILLYNDLHLGRKDT